MADDKKGLKPGTLRTAGGYSDSMAAAMEAALRREWPVVFGPEATTEHLDNPLLKLMLVAIAQGVVQHLQKRAQDAFQIDLSVTQIAEEADPEDRRWIESWNPEEVTVSRMSDGYGSWHWRIAQHDLAVRQKAEEPNRVRSRNTEEDEVVVQIVTDASFSGW